MDLRHQMIELNVYYNDFIYTFSFPCAEQTFCERERTCLRLLQLLSVSSWSTNFATVLLFSNSNTPSPNLVPRLFSRPSHTRWRKDPGMRWSRASKKILQFGKGGWNTQLGGVIFHVTFYRSSSGLLLSQIAQSEYFFSVCFCRIQYCFNRYDIVFPLILIL